MDENKLWEIFREPAKVRRTTACCIKESTSRKRRHRVQTLLLLTTDGLIISGNKTQNESGTVAITILTRDRGVILCFANGVWRFKT